MLVGAVLRFWGAAWGLTDANVARRAQPDEWVVYWMSQWFGRTHSLNPCPSATHACFFDWGSLYPYLTFAMSALVNPVLRALPAGTFGAHADPAFILSTVAGRTLSALASTGTILVVYAIGRQMRSPAVGVLAALVIALAALPIQLAHFATPDSTTILLLALTLYFSLRLSDSGRTRDLVAAGVAAGLATGTEYHMVLLFFPVLAGWYLCPLRSGKRLLLAAGSMAGAAILVNAYILIDLSAFISASEHTLAIRTVHSSAEYGDRFAQYGPWWLYVVRYPFGYGAGAPLTVIAMAGVAWAVYRRSRADLVLLSWTVPYFLLVSLESAKFMRYSAPLFIPLAVLGARGVVELAGAGVPRRVTAIAVLSIVTLYTGSYDAAYASLFTRPDSRLLAAQWLATHAQPGATVAIEEAPNGLINLTYFVANAGLQPCITNFQPRRAAKAAYTVVDTYSEEDHSLFPDAAVSRYFRVVSLPSRHKLVETLRAEPQVLGITFDIDNSPHDWRYPAHRITIYRNVGTAQAGLPCFRNLETAEAAARRAAGLG